MLHAYLLRNVELFFEQGIADHSTMLKRWLVSFLTDGDSIIQDAAPKHYLLP